MQATARKIDDRHLEKLNQIKENIKAQSLSIGSKACIDMIKELDAEILLQIHAIQLSKAAIFLLDYVQSTYRKLFKVSGRVAFIQFNPS